MEAQAKVGRPAFEWTLKVEDEILDRIVSGEAVSFICGTERDDFLPSERTFYKRLSSDEEFAQKYARAKEAQAHREADEIKYIADTATPENVQVARLQIDARKWRAGKLAPKSYGDKVTQEHVGADNGPIQFEEKPSDKMRARLDAIASRTSGVTAED